MNQNIRQHIHTFLFRLIYATIAISIILFSIFLAYCFITEGGI